MSCITKYRVLHERIPHIFPIWEIWGYFLRKNRESYPVEQGRKRLLGIQSLDKTQGIQGFYSAFSHVFRYVRIDSHCRSRIVVPDPLHDGLKRNALFC